MTQFIPQQKTLPERMASIETLLYGFINDFRRYQDSLDETLSAIRAGQTKIQNDMDTHIGSDDKKKLKTWDAIKWEVLKYLILVTVGGLVGYVLESIYH